MVLVVVFTTTYAISDYPQIDPNKVVSLNPTYDLIGVLYTTLCDKVCQWLAAGQWFSPVTQISSTNKTDHHDIAEILLKVALNTKTLTPIMKF